MSSNLRPLLEAIWTKIDQKKSAVARGSAAEAGPVGGVKGGKDLTQELEARFTHALHLSLSTRGRANLKAYASAADPFCVGLCFVGSI